MDCQEIIRDISGNPPPNLFLLLAVSHILGLTFYEYLVALWATTAATAVSSRLDKIWRSNSL
jgi:hypothetical protein